MIMSSSKQNTNEQNTESRGDVVDMMQMDEPGKASNRVAKTMAEVRVIVMRQKNCLLADRTIVAKSKVEMIYDMLFNDTNYELKSVDFKFVNEYIDEIRESLCTLITHVDLIDNHIDELEEHTDVDTDYITAFKERVDILNGEIEVYTAHAEKVTRKIVEMRAMTDDSTLDLLLEHGFKKMRM